ncbi:MAG: nicotinate-nucleotide--dimethylbenzimidazole phosphoribosyltransferase [Smithella sp.]
MNLLESTIKKITPQDSNTRERAKARLDQLIMPHWALGRLLDLAQDLAGITGSLKPPIQRKTIVTMAGDHGVVAEGVSAYPQEVTPQMVHGIVAGVAGVNALSRQAGASVIAVDMGVAGDLSNFAASGKMISKKIAPGTKNMAKGPAMSRDEAIRSLEAGIDIAIQLGSSVDVFGTGDMGIGNTTPSSAIVSVLSGCPVADVTGRGTGVNDSQLEQKISIIEKCISVNQPDKNDGLDILAKVGGFEIGGIAGLILGAASLKKPVVVDGFISTAGALIAHSLAPISAQYMVAAHRSVEKGHRVALDILGKKPLIDLDLRLGEGTGAALAMNFIEAAVRVLTEVATFEEASVSKGDN